MVEIIGRISKGSKMDQIYIPKNRVGFSAGEYVLILPLKGKIEKKKSRPYFYGVNVLEPVKTRIIERIIDLIDKKTNPDNIIITGSFLDKGFSFNDVDILLLNNKKINTEIIKEEIEKLEGIKTHIILLNSKTLSFGLTVDPLYSLMLSKYVSNKKIIFRIKRRINYKILDLSLLKSKTLIDNYDAFNGNEKYYFTMNMVSILLFMQGKKLSKSIVNKKIEKIFNVKISKIKENVIEKQDFLKKYREIFDNTFNLILNNIKKEKNNEQKQAD